MSGRGAQHTPQEGVTGSLLTGWRALGCSGEAVAVYGLLRLLGITTAGLEMMVVNLLGRNSTAVMTNVPGPREPLYFCGARIDDLVFWVPHRGVWRWG